MQHVGKVIAAGVVGAALLMSGSAMAQREGGRGGGAGFHGGGVHGGNFHGGGYRGGGFRGGQGWGNQGFGGAGLAGVGLGLGLAGIATDGAVPYSYPYGGGYGYGSDYSYDPSSGYPYAGYGGDYAYGGGYSPGYAYGTGAYGPTYGGGGSFVAPDTGGFPLAQDNAAPLTTGRSVATGDFGKSCTTPVKTCTLYSESNIGNGCSCKVSGGRSRGTVSP